MGGKTAVDAAIDPIAFNCDIHCKTDECDCRCDEKAVFQT